MYRLIKFSGARIGFSTAMLVLAICAVGCGRNSDKTGDNKNNFATRVDADRVIATELADSAFIAEFFNRFKQFRPLRARVFEFYAARDQRLAWTRKGIPVPHAGIMVNLVKNISDHGLPAFDQNSYDIRDTLSVILDSKGKNNGKATDLRRSFDLALTSLFFQYAPKIWQGSVDPQNEDRIDWFIQPKKIAYKEMLDSILNDQDSRNPFIDYRRFNTQYLKLKEKLQWYSSKESNTPLPTLDLNKEYLERGDSAAGVRELSERLSYFGDLSKQAISDIYTKEVEEAVRRFQSRHGLGPDGVVGATTLNALNISVEDRMQQIMVNMERWRWVPSGMRGDYIYVNIPQFELSVYENNKKVDRMKVIVGKEGAETILFSDKIKYIVINPYWNIPRSIAAEEVLPLIKKDKDYLADENIDVGIKWNFDDVDQDTINWKKESEDNFHYTLRKEPGPNNPLGQIKFLFPNDFAIYLHDTPRRELFDQRERGFSHGCIRIEKPFALAERLLGQGEKATIQRLLKEEQNSWITLPERMPIYILYFTTWVDEHDNIHFVEDIYGHDADLAEVLFNESL